MKNSEAYKIADYTEGAEEYPPRWAKAAAEFRESLGARAQVGVSYGPSDRQVFDFFEPEGVSRGTVIFVHGGYWKAFDGSSWSHLAAGSLAKGWAVAMPTYDLAPDLRIREITAQVSTAVGKIAGRTFGPIALTGHSAGGQLVCRMMDPLVLPVEVRDRVESIVPISPLADLPPLLETEMNEILRLDSEEAQAESPVNMSPPHGVSVAVWVGGEERPALLEQAEALSRSWGARMVVAEGKHHFDVIDALADPDSDMVKALTGG
ncbi:MAG: alpha/beta hydrolase [Sulfitobacter sp.]|nr:alpha/beta hydrolase [Sulfitobacter sp.]